MRDCDVRAALRQSLLAEHANDPNTRIVEEMGIWSGTVRVDVAVINGELSGYELKSDSDTLERLPYQIEIYSKVFDRVTLVVGSKHAKKAADKIPKWWGCIEAKGAAGNVTLRPRRKGRINPNRDANIIAQMLWKDEAVAALEAHGLARGWRSKKAAAICERLVSSLSLADLRHHVREALKARAQLGQVVSGDFNVPVEVQADPYTRIASRHVTRSCDGVDLPVSPTVRQGVSRSAKSDYLFGIPPELLVHGHSSWTFDLDSAEDNKLVGQRVFRVDRSKEVNVDRGPRSDAAVVSEVKSVWQRATGNLSPQNQLSTVERSRTEIEAGKRLRNAASKKRDAAPVAPVVECSKSIRRRDAKGRYVRNAAP